MNNLQVHASPLPFSNKQVQLTVPLGATIADIVNTAMPQRYHAAPVGAVVMINGEIIPREYWGRVRPKPGPHNIAVRIVPTGGGGGKKNPIASLLSIAVMIAAPYIAGAILGPTLAAAQVGIGSLTYGGLLSSVIGVVGRLAVSALAPPPKPSNTGYNGTAVANPAESPTQFIEGARNAINPFGVVPVPLGVNRMFPPQAARPFTETENNDQYVRQLFTYGYGPQAVISSLKIGETDLAQYTNFDMEHRLNGDLHEGTGLYTNDVFQEDLSVLLSEPDGYTTRTTQTGVDEAIVDVTFPTGLCQYSTEGARLSKQVQLELQYAPAGVSPQVWSPGASSYTDFNGAVFNVQPVIYGESPNGQFPTSISRSDVIVINVYSGVIRLLTGEIGSVAAQPIPSNSLRLATVNVTTSRNPTTGAMSSTMTVTDARQASLFGSTLEDSGSFVPSKTGPAEVTITGGAILVNQLDIIGNQKEALRKSVRVVFPEPGQYDLRIRRITADTDSDQIFDAAYLTSIKSVKYQSPVNLQGINGTAVRIKATDQLNGALDQFNAVVGIVIPDYDAATETWIDRVSSNPASIYRYVLQGLPNGKRMSDSQIDIGDLEAWHTYCASQGYSYNRVIDYETSVDEVLRDVASAGSASPAIVDGKRTVAVDQPKDDIVQIITPRNSWGYSGEMIYPDLPHAFRVQFRNSEKGYAQDERVVYDDGYDETNATKFEVLEIQSCVYPDLAFKNGRRHIAAARLRPESHSWMMDVENIVALRGNRVKLEHDCPIVGVGDGRIKTVTTDGGSPEMVTGFTIDDTVTIPNDGVYYTRIRLSDGTQLYKQVNVSVGENTAFTFTTPFTIDDTPAPGDLCYFVAAGGELDLIITRIEPQDDLTARITAINYAQPEINNAEHAAIPAFNSQITTPLEFIRPLAPVLLDQQSDESVMLQNSDGTFTPRAVFTLQNSNVGDVEIFVKARVSGTSVFGGVDLLEKSPERVAITGLEDGKRYDIHFRYKRRNSNQFSLPLELNNYLFIGASGTPDDVTGFVVTVVGNTALLKWDANDDIDLSHYEIRYAPVYSGAAWGTSLVLEETVYENRVPVPFLGGTYLIKAVDRTGNYSTNATAIITYDPGSIENAVAIITENPDFEGTKDNVAKMGDSIYLADPDVPLGYYYFENIVDLTGVFPAFVSATIVANGSFINDIFDMDDIFAESDIFGAGNNNIFDMDDIFSVEDIFGIGNDAWDVQMQYRTTQTDPNNSPAEWSDWAVLEAGIIEFWAIEFRLKMTSLENGVTPAVSQLAVKVDMPDRIERGEDLSVPTEGATVEFDPAFKVTPAVAITIQDGDVDDRIEFISKTASGFEFKVYNGTAGDYVPRSYDFIASGYGRKNT